MALYVPCEYECISDFQIIKSIGFFWLGEYGTPMCFVSRK
jgi:hypothetical protein